MLIINMISYDYSTAIFLFRLTFSILIWYTMFSINSLISEEKTIAIRRTIIIADIMISAVSQTNQMEKNFWFNMFGGKTHKLWYFSVLPPVPCLEMKANLILSHISFTCKRYSIKILS